jgi:DNA-binding Lrp family transcriptional regulator
MSVKTPALARTTDPVTSYEAALAMSLSDLEARVVYTLYLHGPLTCLAMSTLLDLPRDSISPRMRRLEERGKVRRRGYIKLVGRRRRETLWEVTEAINDLEDV